MPEVILTGISIVAITLLWRLGARKTYLDEARDDLFDLRDNLRTYFLSTEKGLHDPLYAKLRNLINGHLRHTERFSFVSYISLIALLRKSKEQIQEVQRKHDLEFFSADQKTYEMSQQIRHRSAEILLIYMVKSSLFARTLIFFAIVHLLLKQINRHLTKLFKWKSYQNYMNLAAIVALTIIPTKVIPGLPADATLNAIETRAFEA
ncbi:MAG: hypothetical protein ITG07_08035 [Candidimonas sp.]|nr:hypothetical protein [Candidimonas sp.]